VTTKTEKPPKGLALEKHEGEAVGAVLPVGFRVLDDADQLIIIKDHPAKGGWVPLVVGGVFTAVGAIGGAASGQAMLGVFAAVGLAALYAGLVSTVNRPRLIASKQGVRVQHKPFPWFGHASPRGEIKQLVVRRDDSYKVNNVPVEQYRVVVVDRAGKEHDLVTGVRTHEQARWIERAIEKHLKLGS
jgi:hypothetical protein